MANTPGASEGPDKDPVPDGPEAETALPDLGEPLPPVDFNTFVLSLSTSALIHMGIAPGPDGIRAAEPDLSLARQTIDLIALLREKTRGNLTGEEERLLDQVLFDLKMRFVELAGRAAR